MSEENVVVRQRAVVGVSRRRHLDERLFLRLPGLLALVSRAIWRLPVRSRLRQAMLRRAARLGIEASNRRDHEATFMVYDPDCECIFPTQLATVGEPGIRGRDERIRWEAKWRSEWGEFQYVPEELIYLDDRVVVVGRIKGSGGGSGVAVNSDWAVLYDVVAGRAVREQVFFDRSEALEAAGLSE